MEGRKETLRLAPRNYNNIANLDDYVNYGYGALSPEVLMHGMPRGERSSDIAVENVLRSKGFHVREEGFVVYLSHDHNADEAFGIGLEDAVRSYIDTFSDDIAFGASVNYAADVLDEYFRTSEDLVHGYLKSKEEEIATCFALFGEGGCEEPPVEKAEVILEASRVYRADKGNTVNISSKMSQNQLFGDGDVAFKFEDVSEDMPIVMAGCGDDLGRTHYPFAEKVVEMVDPRYDGSLLTEHYDLTGKALVSDIADADSLGLDMTERTNRMYEHLHHAYPDSPMYLKIDVFHPPDLGMDFLKKPRPHNAEVIVKVNDSNDNSWMHKVKRGIIEANWKRNRHIREGRYDIPVFSAAREAWLRDRAHLSRIVKPNVEKPMLRRVFDRGLVRKSDYQRRLRCVNRSRFSELALGPVLFLHSRLTEKNFDGVIDLDDYGMYYSHVSASRAVDAMDAALLKLGLTRRLNIVEVPREKMQEKLQKSFQLMITINDHNA